MALYGVGRVSAWIVEFIGCCFVHSLHLFFQIPLLLAYKNASTLKL